MRSLGKSITALVLLLSLTVLIGCEQAEQAIEKTKETIGSVTGSADKSEDEEKNKDAESPDDKDNEESEKK
ncbi:MAG: hypothetical protein KKA54_19225 [Proteobacteria bacterium]|nr:hypothetical protein [Pseudomonadota bacterium]MBU0968503.1 hypothetical protein [Pseudomonadota bacterium]